MGNMLDQFRGKPTQGARPRNTISVTSAGPITRPLSQNSATPQQARLPRAAAIYGGAAAVFAVICIFYLIKGNWFTGLVLIVPTFCLAGFAYYYMKG